MLKECVCVCENIMLYNTLLQSKGTVEGQRFTGTEQTQIILSNERNRFSFSANKIISWQSLLKNDIFLSQ